MRPCVAWRKLTGTSDGRKGGQRNGLEAGPGELENWVVMLPPGNRSTALQLFGSSGVRSTTTQEPTSSPLPALATDDELAEQGPWSPHAPVYGTASMISTVVARPFGNE